MFVDKKIYDKVVSQLTQAVNTIGYGNDDDSKNDIPPLITAEHLERVSGFIEKAKSINNIEITTGGHAKEGLGNFYFLQSLLVPNITMRLFKKKSLDQ